MKNKLQGWDILPEISSLGTEVATWVLRAACRETGEEKGELKEELLNLEASGLVGFEQIGLTSSLSEIFKLRAGFTENIRSRVEP